MLGRLSSFFVAAWRFIACLEPMFLTFSCLAVHVQKYWLLSRGDKHFLPVNKSLEIDSANLLLEWQTCYSFLSGEKVYILQHLLPDEVVDASGYMQQFLARWAYFLSSSQRNFWTGLSSFNYRSLIIAESMFCKIINTWQTHGRVCLTYRCTRGRKMSHNKIVMELTVKFCWNNGHGLIIETAASTYLYSLIWCYYSLHTL